MLKTTPERFVSATQELPGIRLTSPEDADVFDEWLSLRRAFMEREGWRSGDDRDIYDDDRSTDHIITRKDESVVAGMRLTPAARLEETLSWSMLTPAMQHEASTRLPEASGTAAWDLTRLVGGNIGEEEVADTFVRMFAVGLSLNQEALMRRGDMATQPRWFFATTSPLLRFFRRQGIAFKPIAKGKINPQDRCDSVFCYIDPADPSSSAEWIDTHAPVYADMYKAAMQGMLISKAGEGRE